MQKNKKNIKIDFSNGDAAEHVSGSAIYIKSKTSSILLECGLSQSNNLKLDYLTNKEKFNFKVKDLDYVFCMHAHADHSARIPLLYKRGCKAIIIVPENTKRILKDMFTDSAHIMERDSEQLKRLFRRRVEPLYNDEDVENALNHIVEYPFNTVINLDENISFRFIPSGHIICGSQLELWITENNITKKIVYTSDLGNNLLEKNYVEKFEPIEKADLFIGECTYGNPERKVANLKQRVKDLEKLKCVIEEECVFNKHKVLIPVFALDRLTEILTELYKIFGNNKEFDIPILIDTPLGIKHVRSYFNILSGDKLKLLDDVMKWENIIQIDEYSMTESWALSPKPCVILSSSGMLTAGRSVTYAEHLINDENSTIIFCGYSTEGTIGWKIKHAKDYKYIEINGKKKRNKCKVVDLHSFSSHMQFPSLLEYYSNIKCNQIALVHGQMESKIPFSKILKTELEKQNKTSKVTVVNRSTIINI